MKNTEFTVPQRNEVSETNQAIFDKLKKMVGFVPNLYAYYAHSDTALKDYLDLQNRRNSLRTKEREIINLIVSQVNNCRYCQSAHTQMGLSAGFTEEQIIEIRKADISFDKKFDALVKFAKSTAENKGRATEDAKLNFFEAGYTQENLVDTVIVIGDKIISNYLHILSDIEIDWPLADEI
tara:strand:- start:11068 stop:11607 length:540 start_codon:yes stop_codon:yes gene_type:complete